jgi:hypothetical protein
LIVTTFGFSQNATREAAMTGNQLIAVTGMSNREFLETYARAGRVGLSGGTTLIDKAVCAAERHVDENKRWSYWSHSFLFEGARCDGQHWVIESDLQAHRKHISLGVQENRLAKYFNEELYTCLAVLDFGLPEEQVAVLLREGLELVASRTRYSLRELIGTVLALRHPGLREHENLLAREQSLYCSAFIQHLFLKIGIDFAPAVETKNTTPEDISRTATPHVTYLLKRRVATSALARIARRVRRRVRVRLKRLGP